MKQQIIDFLRGRLDPNAVEFTINTIYNEHSSLVACDPLFMQTQIRDLLDEYAQDNDLDEDFWMESFDDEEDILMSI